MIDDPPTLEELADEFLFVESVLKRVTERLRRGITIPKHTYQAVVVLTKAYNNAVMKHYPKLMVEDINKLKIDLREFRNKYNLREKEKQERNRSLKRENRQDYSK